MSQRAHLLEARRGPEAGAVSHSARPGLDVSQNQDDLLLWSRHAAMSLNLAVNSQSPPFASHTRYFTGSSPHAGPSFARDRVTDPSRKHATPTSAALFMPSSIGRSAHDVKVRGRSVGDLTLARWVHG